MTRRGFTIIELLVTLGVVGILGTALARLLVNTSRFVSRQEAQMEARLTARAAYNLLSNDVRSLGEGISVWLATPTEVRLSAPYEWGILCQPSAGASIVSIMPADSTRSTSSVPSVLTWRQSDGTWGIREWPSVTGSLDADACAADSIRVIPGGRLRAIAPTVPAPAGTIIRIDEAVWYRFSPSSSLPGRVGLFRRRGVGVNQGIWEEVLAPFGSDASFRFLTGSSLTPLDMPPADLSTLQGLELQLIAESEETPSGAPGPEEFRLITSITFHNTRM